MSIDPARLDDAIDRTRAHLLSLRVGDHWEGRLSSSAVATATSVMALALADREEDRPLVDAGCAWLARTQNVDGGFGDTPGSPSNIAASLLAMCALSVAQAGDETTGRLRAHIDEVTGDAGVAAAVRRRYGDDLTFAAPILAACALAGIVPWREVPALPFELALLPRSLHRLLRLQVVSYALPALIAVGAMVHRHAPGGNPLSRLLRSAGLGRAVAMLPGLQPERGGFLEAAPLTGFVAMSLVDIAGPEHEVVRRCLRFLRETVRDDGSWAIDTNLSVWVTTNALAALRCSGPVPRDTARTARSWLLDQQHDQVHPFTGAAPGGWAWTHLPGGVPDADDTAGAVLTLLTLDETEAGRAGVGWLAGLHNPDGGWPTFCQGWGRLPFDQSSPDITAHALRAVTALMDDAQSADDPRLAQVIDLNLRQVVGLGFRYLRETQRADGSWVPLWFGNQHAPGGRNPIYGTARALAAYADCDRADDDAARRGLAYLVGAQNDDGGWGGAGGVPSSVEETAVAVSALSRFASDEDMRDALLGGVEYLLARVEDGTWTEPSPIGLYFASLWYTEALYPVAWTVEALGRARRVLVGG